MERTRYRAILCGWGVEYWPVILPVLATVALALLLGYHALDQVERQSVLTGWFRYLSWLRYIPEWLRKVVLVVLITVIPAFLAGRFALKYRVGANVAALAGVGTTVALATWLCDLMGGIVIGLVIAVVIIAGSVAVGVIKERGLGRTGQLSWLNSVSEQSSIGTIQFAQIAIALYMGTVALIAVTNAVSAEFLWDVLLFCGIGITAASALSEQGGLRNVLAMVGSGIALFGSYFEMDRALAMGDGEPTAMVVLLAAGLVIYGPSTALALRAVHWVRILIAPMLVAGLSICVTFVATSIPAILVSVGCNLKAEYSAVLIGASAPISVVVGVVVFCIVLGLVICSWRKVANAKSGDING